MTEGRISPLRQRMIEDMNIRHFAANTQEAYIRAVEKLARCNRSHPPAWH
jgi:integrase/recombinase XerD